MSELEPEDQVAEVEPAAEPVHTGVDQVDAVLDSLHDLDQRPVDEHVAVFERAHEQLRGALDSGG